MTRSISLIMLVSALMGFQMPSIASANEVELKAYSADEAVNLDLNNLTDADKLSDMLDNQSFMPPGGPGPRPMPPGPGPRPGPGPGPGHPPYNPGPRPPYNPGPRPPYNPPYNPGPRPPYYPPYNPPRPVPPPYYPPYPSQPYVTCYSQNYRGEVFSASGYDYSQNIQQRALNECYLSYDPNGCIAMGCSF